MINDMPYHAKAWKRVANEELGGSFSDDEIKRNMYGKNTEVLVRLFGKDRFTEAEMERLSHDKEEQYRREFISELNLLPGLNNFLQKAFEAGIPMAIGSAAIMANIDFVLDNLNIRHYFSAIVSADDVTHSKPNPESFLKPALLLGVDPADCIVFEDVPKGAEAAKNAGMQAVILTTTHPKDDFKHLDNILHFATDYNDVYFKGLI